MTNSELLARFTPLANQIAGGFLRKLPSNVLHEDIRAAAMAGLWDAIQKHDGKTLENFEWYVRVRIRGSIIDELRAQDWLPRRAREAAMKAAEKGEYRPAPAVVRFDDVSEWEQNRMLSQAASSEAACVAKEAQENIFGALDRLPARERYIVSQHYLNGVRLKDIAEEFQISEARISQLHSRALARLKASANLSAP